MKFKRRCIKRMTLCDTTCFIKCKRKKTASHIFHLPERSTELIVVHVRFCFSFSPTARHFVRIDKFELTVGTLPSNKLSVRRIS